MNEAVYSSSLSFRSQDKITDLKLISYYDLV